jgi:hypothetical protein
MKIFYKALEILSEALKPLNEYKNQFDEKTWDEFGDQLIAARAAGLSFKPERSSYVIVKKHFENKTADEVEDEILNRAIKQKERKDTDIVWSNLQKRVPHRPIKSTFDNEKEYQEALQKYRNASNQARRAYGLIKGKIKAPQIPNKDAFENDKIGYRNAMEKYMKDKAQYDEEIKRYTGDKPVNRTKVVSKEIKQKIINVQKEFTNLASKLTSSTSTNKVGRLEHIKDTKTYFENSLSAKQLKEAAQKYYTDAMEVLNSKEINNYFGAIGRTPFINSIKSKFNDVKNAIEANEKKVEGTKGTRTLAGMQLGRVLVLASKEFYRLVPELKMEQIKETKFDATEQYNTKLTNMLSQKSKLQYDIDSAIDERTKKVERSLTDEELEKEKEKLNNKYKKLEEEYKTLSERIKILSGGKIDDYNEAFKKLTSNDVDTDDGKEREIDTLKRMSRYLIGQMQKLEVDLEKINKKVFDEVSLSDEEKNKLKQEAKEQIRFLELRIKELNSKPLTLGHLVRTSQGAMRHAKENIYANVDEIDSNEKDIGIKGKTIKAETGSFLHSVNKMRNLDTTSVLSLESLANTIKEIFSDAGIIKGSRRNSDGDLIEPEGGERIPREPTMEDFQFNFKETQARLSKNKHLSDEEKRKYIREAIAESKESFDNFKKLFTFYEKVNKNVEVFKFRKQYSDAKVKESVTNMELQKYSSWVDDNQEEIKEVKKIIMDIQDSGLSTLSALARGIRNSDNLSKEKINDRIRSYEGEQAVLSNKDKVNQAFSHIKDSMDKIKENKKFYEPIKYNYKNFKGTLREFMKWASKNNKKIEYGTATKRFVTSSGSVRWMYPIWINNRVYFIDKSLWLSGATPLREIVIKEFNGTLKKSYNIIETMKQAYRDADKTPYQTSNKKDDDVADELENALKDNSKQTYKPEPKKEEIKKEEPKQTQAGPAKIVSVKKKEEDDDVADELENALKDSPEQTYKPELKKEKPKKIIPVKIVSAKDKKDDDIADDLEKTLKDKEKEEKEEEIKRKKKNDDVADELENALKK